MSEHTSEYALVYRLITAFSTRNLRAIPIYFLSTREGGKVSSKCDDSSAVRLISVYARRPKVDFPNQPTIEMKINAELFEAARRLGNFGIPTFTGIPLISSLWDFNLDVKIAWFEFTGESDGDVYFHISTDGKGVERFSESTAIRGPLLEDDVIDICLRSSHPMCWVEAIEILKMNRRAGRRDSEYRGPFGGGYYPFYLIVL